MSGSRYWIGYSLVASIGLGLVCLNLWTRLQVVATGYTLSNVSQLMQTLEGDQRALEAEWSGLTALGRLAEHATQRLGLTVPQPGQVMQLR